jgi:hypothetical protein
VEIGRISLNESLLKTLFSTQKVMNHSFLWSCAHAPTCKRRGINSEKNIRKRRTLHGLRTLRSLLHSPALQIKRHNQSLQQGKSPSNQPRKAGSAQTRFFRHPMQTLRRRPMCHRLPLRRHAKRRGNRLSNTRPRVVHRLLDLHHGLPVRRHPKGCFRKSSFKMRPLRGTGNSSLRR